MRRLAIIVVCAAALVVAGCSSAARRPGAAEPASAPPTTAAPAGTIRALGAGTRPEGIVYDPRTRLVAVAVHDPDRLLLLDPTTLAVKRTVALPGSARHLQVDTADDEVLVPAETANQLVQVSLSDGATTVTDVLKQPHDAAASDGDVVVGNEFGTSISVIRDGRVIKTIHDLKQPGGVIADGATVGVVDVGAFTLSTYDLQTLRRTAVVRAGEGPTHGVLLDGNRMAVADTRGNQLLVFSVDPLRQIGRLALPGTPYGMAVDGDTVWVTLTARNQVVGVDASTDRPRVVARYATVRQPNTVTVAPGGGTLWITGTDAGVVERIGRSSTSK